MALALLTGCGTGSSASHKSIAKAMADYDNSLHRKTTITCTSSAVLDAKLQEQAKKPGFEDVVKNVYKGTLTSFTIPSNSDLSGKVVYLYCGKYDKDAGKQAINLNAHYAYSSSTSTLADVREIGLITTSFTMTPPAKRSRSGLPWWCRTSPPLPRNTAQHLSPRSHPGGFFCA